MIAEKLSKKPRNQTSSNILFPKNYFYFILLFLCFSLFSLAFFAIFLAVYKAIFMVFLSLQLCVILSPPSFSYHILFITSKFSFTCYTFMPRLENDLILYLLHSSPLIFTHPLYSSTSILLYLLNFCFSKKEEEKGGKSMKFSRFE